MKRILFIMDSFPLGGISKSLLALLNELDGKYDIDLLLMYQDGLFLPLIPRTVNLLNEPLERAFRDPHPCNILRAKRTLKFRRWLLWCRFSFRCCCARITKGLHGHINTMDKWIGKHASSIDKHYDAAIAYQGGRCVYYLAEKVNANVKIGYVHSNYSVNETDNMLKPSDSFYFPQMDSIITISPVCLAALKTEFPALAKRCFVVENICSPRMINRMAVQGASYDDGFTGIRIASMGRFDIKIKGIDIAIEACQLLKKNKIVFRWYWLGDGAQRPLLERMIRDAGVEDVFILLGAKINPYPYIKDTDIYVQPSRIEGKSVALDEVKALYRPIVVTNFDSVNDQFTHGRNALICEMNAKDLVLKIEQLIVDGNLRDALVRNLKHEKVGNEEQVHIFESLLTQHRLVVES